MTELLSFQPMQSKETQGMGVQNNPPIEYRNVHEYFLKEKQIAKGVDFLLTPSILQI